MEQKRISAISLLENIHEITKDEKKTMVDKYWIISDYRADSSSSTATASVSIPFQKQMNKLNAGWISYTFVERYEYNREQTLLLLRRIVKFISTHIKRNKAILLPTANAALTLLH